ncbi:MAG: hypothetical protein ABUL49_01950, partial [bacterium]
TADEQFSYQNSTQQLLLQPFWRDDKVQSRTFEVMVPKHAAFWGGPKAWRHDYAHQFDLFLREGLDGMHGNLLSRLHYLQFAARFLALSAEFDRSQFRPALQSMVEREWKRLWLSKTDVFSQTGWGEPKIYGYEAYLNWKVQQPRAGA